MCKYVAVGISYPEKLDRWSDYKKLREKVRNKNMLNCFYYSSKKMS